MNVKLELMYRCGANYKTFMSVVVDSTTNPDVLNLKVDDEITMGEYGTMEQSKFFDEYFEGKFDEEFDHNLLSVEAVVKPKKVQVTSEVTVMVTMEVESFGDDDLEEKANEVIADTDYSFDHDSIVSTEIIGDELSSHASIED